LAQQCATNATPMRSRLNIKTDKFSAEQMRAWGFSGTHHHFGKADQPRALFRKQEFSMRFSKALAEGLNAVFGESFSGWT
jgi:hypothetical protein